MTLLFGFIYILFITGVALASFFIVTNLQKYSINPKFTEPLIVTYIVVTIALIIINVILFINIPFESLFYNQIYY